jgi:hypothetical protein
LSWVAILTTNPRETPPESTLTVANRCIASGRRTCDLVQKLEAIEQFNAVTWWDIYYTYSSALIIVLNAICDTVRCDYNAARDSTRCLGECARLATKHLKNPMMPATIRRWATTVNELNAMATDFVQGFEDQSTTLNAFETLATGQTATHTRGHSNQEILEYAGVNSMPYATGPLPTVTPSISTDSVTRSSSVPWTQLQPMDLERATFWSELHWDSIEDMLLGDQRASWEN